MFHDSEHPHQGQPVIEKGKSLDKARGAVILIHGRGATAESILTLADELQRFRDTDADPSADSDADPSADTDADPSTETVADPSTETDAVPSAESDADPSSKLVLLSDLAWLAPQASFHTWYPYSFLAPLEQNEPGLSSGLQVIGELIDKVTAAGIPKEKIVLAGFSQGACLSSEYAARNPDRYGGVVALSGGVIGPELERDRYQGSMDGTPVFLGCSDYDPHIPEKRVHQTADLFEQLDADVTKIIYEGLGHTVNKDEFRHFNLILDKL